MKKALLIFICAVASKAAYAEAPFDYTKAKKAVELSATADAYGKYCKKPSVMSDDYIKRFESEGVDKNKIETLKDIQASFQSQTLQTLNDQKQDCKNIEFMLKRLELMRSLKDISYEMNGIDPASVKDNIPSVELLQPGKPPEMPPEALKAPTEEP